MRHHHPIRGALLGLAAALLLAACSHEAADWKAAAAADSSEAYQQFLTQHPNSANAQQARARIQQIQEAHDWQAATSADSREAYEQFVAQHPDSHWAQEARIRIENFAQSSGAAAGAATAAHSAASASSSRQVATLSGAHYVQLGAYSSRAGAESQWQRLSVKYARELGSLTPRYIAGKLKARPVVRLQVAVPVSAG
jgi:outer membrane protein assembly factor BamD (BamD/ComL family)